jgi:hypothetical protein
MLSAINTEHNIQLYIDVVAYEFPQEKVVQDNRVFEKVDPALEADEIEHIYDWFECLSNAQLPKYSNLTFTEPCLGFEFLSNRNGVVRIAIDLNHELKPDFELRQFAREQKDWRIIFDLKESDFKQVLEGIKGSKSQFPVRS